ncbi:hypothetical protein GCM10010430_77030 [Kitasatospora cystarginea]|uniref:Uncharacterized protein n=1 Tax=Kitasatospora cystarginea TaxID=58350 RepID=A0ABN3F0A1_9ACTN
MFVPEAINPTAIEQLRVIREIFPPEKEALGCLAIEIEKLQTDMASAHRRILTVCKGSHRRAPLAAAVLARRGGPALIPGPPPSALGTSAKASTR